MLADSICAWCGGGGGGGGGGIVFLSKKNCFNPNCLTFKLKAFLKEILEKVNFEKKVSRNRKNYPACKELNKIINKNFSVKL